MSWSDENCCSWINFNARQYPYHTIIALAFCTGSIVFRFICMKYRCTAENQHTFIVFFYKFYCFWMVSCKKYWYRIAQNFGGRKLWRIWRFIANPPKFYPPKSCEVSWAQLNSEPVLSTTKVFSTNFLVVPTPPKFSPAKVLCYTVNCFLNWI